MNEDSPVHDRLLCERRKTVRIFIPPSGRHFRVVAEMDDEIHHITMSILLDQVTLKIMEINCEMPGVPDEVCRQAATIFDPLVGEHLRPGLIKKLKASPQNGCLHLADLFRDACYNAAFAQWIRGREKINAMFPDASEEQFFEISSWFHPELHNSCIRYSGNSPFMERVRNVKLPARAEKIRTAVMSRLHGKRR